MSQFTSTSTATQAAQTLSSEIKDKVVLVTGVSAGGLGASFLEIIAVHSPKLLILAGRNQSKGQEEASKISSIAPSVATRLLTLDLSSQKQIRQAASEVLSYAEAIDVLVLNAGIMAVPYSKTADGLESQFGANHIGHFLFTNLIMPKLLASRHSTRIVSVSSDGHRFSPIRFDDLGFDNGDTYNRWRAYGQFKSANILFAVELAKRVGHRGVTAVSLHPGTIMTNLLGNAGLDMEAIQDIKREDKAQGHSKGWSGINLVDLDVGTATHVFAAFDPLLQEHNGAYCEAAGIKKVETTRCWARDPVEATRLWQVSEEIVGEKFHY